MIRFAFALAAFAAASPAFAGDDFHGLNLVPRFDRDDALVVEVTNGTKMTLTVTQLDVIVPGSTSSNCRFSVKKTLVVTPTFRQDVVIASAKAARGCLRSRPGLERATARGLTLAHERRKGEAQPGELLAVAAAVDHEGRRLQASSRWFVQQKRGE